MLILGMARRTEVKLAAEKQLSATLLLCEFISDDLGLARTNRPRGVACFLARLILGCSSPFNAPR